jgi:mono/diheme cytochrome c family protein
MIPIQRLIGMLIPITYSCFAWHCHMDDGFIATGNMEAGKQLYQQRCSVCHGPDGKSNTPTAQALTPKPRDHTNGAYMNALSNEHLAKVISKGGAAVGKSPLMPPQADLNDQQIQDLIVFLRSLAVPPYKGN